MQITTTPWGPPQPPVHHVAEGIAIVSTAGHGGVVLSPERAAQVPAHFRPWTQDRQFWEEDYDFYVPVVVFEDEFRTWYISQGLQANFEDLIVHAKKAVAGRDDGPPLE